MRKKTPRRVRARGFFLGDFIPAHAGELAGGVYDRLPFHVPRESVEREDIEEREAEAYRPERPVGTEVLAGVEPGQTLVGHGCFDQDQHRAEADRQAGGEVVLVFRCLTKSGDASGEDQAD